MQTSSVELAPQPRGITLTDFWMFGILAFGLVILGNLIRFKQIQFNSRPADDSAQKILLQCKKELNIHRSVRLLENGFFPEY